MVAVDKALFPELTGARLPPKEHRAKFLDQDFFGELPPTFTKGALVVESDVPVIATVLKTEAGLILSALPLATVP